MIASRGLLYLQFGSTLGKERTDQSMELDHVVWKKENQMGCSVRGLETKKLEEELPHVRDWFSAKLRVRIFMYLEVR